MPLPGQASEAQLGMPATASVGGNNNEQWQSTNEFQPSRACPEEGSERGLEAGP
ncbi:hypothetical protein ACLOJK_027640 [Asimina triloba]